MQVNHQRLAVNFAWQPGEGLFHGSRRVVPRIQFWNHVSKQRTCPPLSSIVGSFGIASHQLYADDAHVYVSITFVILMTVLFSSYKNANSKWMTSNMLNLNRSKQNLCFLVTSCWSRILPFVPHWQFRGKLYPEWQGIFNSDLSFDLYISPVCQPAFCHIRDFTLHISHQPRTYDIITLASCEIQNTLQVKINVITYKALS